jgi:integrase
MRGSKIEVRPGVFRVRVYDKRAGRYISKTVEGSKEADRQLAEIIVAVTSGRQVDRNNITVGEFLERWLQFIDNTDLAGETKRSYRLHIEKHFKTAVVKLGKYRAVKIWDIRLAELGPEVLQAYFAQALAEGRKDIQRVRKADRDKPRDLSLSATTVNAHYRTWHVALEWARGQQWIEQNPAELTKPPRPEKKRFRRLKAHEARILLEANKNHWIRPLLMCALHTGLRQGEMLALRWKDIDWESKTLMPRRTLKRAGPNPAFKDKPKTDSSLAPVPITGALLAELTEEAGRTEACGRADMARPRSGFCHAGGHAPERNGPHKRTPAGRAAKGRTAEDPMARSSTLICQPAPIARS